MTILFVLVCVFVASVYLLRSGERKHRPPGPSPLPILGNLFDIPTAAPWRVYAEWKKKYGM
jgi:hypothetical protein